MHVNGLPSSIMAQIQQLESQDPQALVAVFDAFGYYLYASAGHEQVLGYTAEELLKSHLSKIVDLPEHHAAYVLRTISVFYRRPIPFSSRLVAKSGTLIPVAGTLQHFRAPNGVRYFLTSVLIEAI